MEDWRGSPGRSRGLPGLSAAPGGVQAGGMQEGAAAREGGASSSSSRQEEEEHGWGSNPTEKTATREATRED